MGRTARHKLLDANVFVSTYRKKLKSWASSTYSTLCRTKIHRPEIFEVPNQKWRAVQLPSKFESFYLPHICAFVAFLRLPFITINHTAYILTEDNNTFS